MLHPDHLAAVLTSRQIAEWQAFNTLSPIGGGRMDYLLTAVRAAVFTAAGAKGVSIPKLMPQWGGRAPQQMSNSQIRAAFGRLKRKS